MAGEGPAPLEWRSLERLLSRHGALQKDFERLVRTHDALQRDFGTLLACLRRTHMPFASCIQFRANEFKVVRSCSPLGRIRTKLSDALPIKAVRLLQQFCGGRREMLPLTEVSRSVRTCTDSIFAGCELFICGGQYARDTIAPRSMECLHLEAQTWEAIKPPLMEPCGSAGVVFGQAFYVCGGTHCMLSRTAQRFCYAEQKWETLGAMNVHRHAPAAAVVGGRLYVCGGEDAARVHNSIEWFDASAPHPRRAGRPGAWRLLPAALSVGRRYFAAAAIGIGAREELLVCGGMASPGCCDSDDAVVLDSAEAAALSWQEPRPRRLPPMAGPRCCHVAARLRGRVFACGGESTPGQGGVTTVERFDPESESWSACVPMLRGRMLAAAAVLAGRLYVLGGCQRYDAEDVPAGERSVESCPDPATKSWEAAAWELPRARLDFCAAAARRGELAK